MRTIGQALDPKRNSLNFLRLVLAFSVVYAHASEYAWLGWRNVVVNDTSLGAIAVYGFFGISGYLIAGSLSRNSVPRYIWQRFLRIFPAFWVCLVVTAFVFGAVAWLHQRSAHCGLSCYLGLHPGPFSYVYSNALLKINQPSVVSGGLYSSISNASLWTLFYEFLCYLFLAGLALIGIFRYRALVLTITLGLLATLSILTFTPSLNRMFSVAHHFITMEFLILSVVFMVGSLVWLYRDVVPDSPFIAVPLAIVFVASLHLPREGNLPTLGFTASSLGAFLLAYPLLWLGAHLPFHRIGSKNDYSYGVYIYAFPLTQLMVIFGADRLGFVPFMVVNAALALAFAIASWWLIEKHALRLKRVSFSGLRPRVRRLPAAVPDADASVSPPPTSPPVPNHLHLTSEDSDSSHQVIRHFGQR
jgi:peptidoglycan/LPS O-acetylase OafA/YrhL